ncbi:MAG TPA: protoporphyrinogen oxidase, partial [Planctomycetota bacterium]|nr:protoporphyrinogen oxidase [Planctomycetota bacterium]
MSERVGTLVLGAGISGLSYAHTRKDADLLVLEASDHAGGLMRTLRADGVRYEGGPEAMQTGSDEADELVRELGLEMHTVPAEAKARYVVKQGELIDVPMSPPALLKTHLLSAGGKARALTEKWRNPRKALDGSVADFVRHRLGHEVLEALVDPLISGIYAGDPEQISLRGAFPEVAKMVEEHGSLMAAMSERRGKPKPSLTKPAGGLGEIPAALARSLGDRLRLSSAAKSIERDGDTWRVATDTAELRASRLVIALPPRAGGGRRAG